MNHLPAFPAQNSDAANAESGIYRVLVIDAHPRGDSFCRGLAEAAAGGAAAALHEVRTLVLRDMDFNQNHTGQELESCLVQSRQDILWAEHLIIVHPVWWGTMPALLKGWLDRILLPGFAFAEGKDGGWAGLLGGRSATIISTLDTPLWIYRLILRAPSIHALRDATLVFCGIRPVKVILFGDIRHSSARTRATWLEQARQVGFHLDQTLRSGWRPRVKAWLQAMRPQFYVFPWMAITAGAVSAIDSPGGHFRWASYILCWAAAWLMEFITVLTNELHDLPTDKLNRNSGPFTGGSRVLLGGVLNEIQIRKGWRIASRLLIGIVLGFAYLNADHLGVVLALSMGALVLGMGYTAPPLKLSWRTWGEVTVAFTHSVLLVLWGHVSQGGGLTPEPWLIALPMFFAILPSIILAGFPDLEADAAVGKKTLVVRLGRRAAVVVATGAVLLAVLLRRSLFADPSWLDFAILIHGAALLLALATFFRQPYAGRMNGLLVLALSFMLWFAWVS